METEKKTRKQRQPKKVQPVTIDPEPIDPEPTVAEPEPDPKPEQLPPPKKRGIKKGTRMVEHRKNDFRYKNTKVPVDRYKELLEIEKKYNMLVNDIAINNISK